MYYAPRYHHVATITIVHGSNLKERQTAEFTKPPGLHPLCSPEGGQWNEEQFGLRCFCSSIRSAFFEPNYIPSRLAALGGLPEGRCKEGAASSL